jgi:hypothetical protein
LKSAFIRLINPIYLLFNKSDLGEPVPATANTERVYGMKSRTEQVAMGNIPSGAGS